MGSLFFADGTSYIIGGEKKCQKYITIQQSKRI